MVLVVNPLPIALRTGGSAARPIPPHAPAATTILYLTRLRVDIATNCAHGDLKEALQAWDEGLEYIEMLPHTRVQATLREGWVEWQAQIQERQTAIASAADQSSDSSVSRNLAT